VSSHKAGFVQFTSLKYSQLRAFPVGRTSSVSFRPVCFAGSADRKPELTLRESICSKHLEDNHCWLDADVAQECCSSAC